MLLYIIKRIQIVKLLYERKNFTKKNGRKQPQAIVIESNQKSIENQRLQ